MAGWALLLNKELRTSTCSLTGSERKMFQEPKWTVRMIWKHYAYHFNKRQIYTDTSPFKVNGKDSHYGRIGRDLMILSV